LVVGCENELGGQLPFASTGHPSCWEVEVGGDVIVGDGDAVPVFSGVAMDCDIFRQLPVASGREPSVQLSTCGVTILVGCSIALFSIGVKVVEVGRQLPFASVCELLLLQVYGIDVNDDGATFFGPLTGWEIAEHLSTTLDERCEHVGTGPDGDCTLALGCTTTVWTILLTVSLAISFTLFGILSYVLHAE
jgi:hypothetical protein